MKISWGTGIAIFYSCFVLVMIMMVVKSARVDVNMVEEDYYQTDLNYQEVRDSRSNAEKVVTDRMVYYDATEREVSIHFPPLFSDPKGMVHFYRPSDRRLDKKFDISIDDNQIMQISSDRMSRGYWKVLIDWSFDGKKYSWEETLVL